MRTVTHATAARIAGEWYTPRTEGLVALATWHRPLTDSLALRVVSEARTELDAHPRNTELRQLVAYCEAETRHRGLAH